MCERETIKALRAPSVRAFSSNNSLYNWRTNKCGTQTDNASIVTSLNRCDHKESREQSRNYNSNEHFPAFCSLFSSNFFFTVHLILLFSAHWWLLMLTQCNSLKIVKLNTQMLLSGLFLLAPCRVFAQSIFPWNLTFEALFFLCDNFDDDGKKN